MRKAVAWFAVALLAPIWSAQAATPEFPHLEIRGSGKVFAVPDSAQFTVEVRKLEPSAVDAKQAADRVVVDFIERLQQAGVPRDAIQSGNLQLNPEFDYNRANNERKQIGYRAVRRVTVEVSELEQLNDFLDAALGDGVDAISSIQLKNSDAESYQQQARALAIADARRQADIIAKGFDMQIEGVWQVRYLSQQPMPMMRSMAMDSAVESSYQDSRLVMSDSIDVIFKLK